MYQPQHNSKRSKKRNNRNFVDLKTSSRKHRRAARRQYAANLLIDGKLMAPGEHYEPTLGRKLKIFDYTGSGKLNYH